MQVFPKIAKTIFYTLILVVVFLFTMDFGKIFMTESENYFIARNSGDFVAKFSINASELTEYQTGTITLDQAKKSLEEYFDLQYENMGYEKVPSTIAGGGSNKFKAVYKPKNEKDGDQRFRGHVFVRAILTNFNESGGNGTVEVNIEQKIPAGVRTIMEMNGVPFKTVENPTDGRDYEGFIGFYSVVVNHKFNVKIL